MNKENIINILFPLVLLCLISTAEARGRVGGVGRGGGRRQGGGGKGGVSLFICFGEGCSGLDVTLTCLSILMILWTMCCCLRDCAKCCDECCEGEEEEEFQSETV